MPANINNTFPVVGLFLHLFLKATLKELLKLAHIYQSHHKIKSGTPLCLTV